MFVFYVVVSFILYYDIWIICHCVVEFKVDSMNRVDNNVTMSNFMIFSTFGRSMFYQLFI